MRPEDLVFWIDVLPDDLASAGGVLCLRHADSMVVPRGWTLDDLRDPELRLFRPPVPRPVVRLRTHRAPRVEPPEAAQQLELDPPTVEVEPRGVSAPVAPPADEDPGPWSPAFDEADDLDGLLDARGPLLARAFRTADRPNG